MAALRALRSTFAIATHGASSSNKTLQLQQPYTAGGVCVCVLLFLEGRDEGLRVGLGFRVNPLNTPSHKTPSNPLQMKGGC